MSESPTPKNPPRISAERPAHPAAMPFGLLEITALLAALGWTAVTFYAPDSMFRPVLLLVLLVTGIIVAARAIRRLVKYSVWRLRNRLLFSYVFIAVVPVMLLFSLAWIGAWILAGQTAAYLVAAEFSRNIEVLNDSSAAVLRGDAAGTREPATRLIVFLSSRFPGVQYLYTRPGEPDMRFPADSTLTPPPKAEADQSGVLVKDDMLYGWAHHHNEKGSVTVITPLTKRFLTGLVRNLGEITLVDLSPDEADKSTRMRLHDAGASASEPALDLLSMRGVPAPTNFFDLQVLWGTTLPVHDWANPGQERRVLLGVHTRIAQVYRVIFSQKADWDQPLLLSAFYAIALLFLFFEFVALVIGISITRTITGAVHHLYEATLRVQAADFSTRIPVKGTDQLAELSGSFNTMTTNLEKLLVVAKDNERLQADLAIAREVQEQLYPRTVPPSESLVLTAKLNPARAVSGDYYDYQRIHPQRIAIALGDVAGKGISAALLMANVQSALRAQIRHTQEIGHACSTSLVVSQLNKHLHAHTTAEKYATFYFGVYDENTGVLTSTNAGHLQPLLFRRGEVQRLDVNGMVVGAFALAVYDESSVQLEKDDLLVLYTDGITEPENEYEEMFGEDRLIETIQRVIDQSNEAIIAEVFRTVEQWIHAPDSNDDMTILLVRRVA
ncbi:MAG: SpoIIE family protein phosphatase [Acidobacteria bacterium]|nr:SpoIIE family protein phosphatase [Acidobacteriota bacterium]